MADRLLRNGSFRRHGPAFPQLFFFVLATVAALALYLTTDIPSQAAGDPVIVAAGDIACDPTIPDFNGGNGTANVCHMKATGALIGSINPVAVLALGDTQYDSGTLTEFAQSYNPSWGPYKSKTYPIVGNHEYLTTDATGYFSYFGSRAGDPTKGYYSFNIGTWHLIALNSECVNVGSCKPGSPQETWLKADLAANAGRCTLAMWHEPLFSSGRIGNNPQTLTFWQDLQAARADIVLTGHEHDYERFGLQTATQTPSSTNGIREFVVGTGGADHGGSAGFPNLQPNSQVRDNTTFGVLKLTLHPKSYDWQFVPEPGGTFTDSGTTACHTGSTAPVIPSQSIYLPLVKR